MDFEIVKMQKRHLDALAELEKECFSMPWSADSFEDELTNEYARFFVAESGGTVIGYIGAFNVYGEVSLGNLAVTASCRNQGVATALLEFLCKYVEDESAEFVTLEVRASNETAIRLYKKLGFKKSGLRKDFYHKPTEDALLMKKSL